MSSWHSYAKIWNLGHANLGDFLSHDLQIEEKIDGSQISFGIFNSILKMKSKGKVQEIEAPDRMFEKAAETIKEIAPLLMDGWTYRGEYLQKPKHNSLSYGRVPDKNIIIFDINRDEEDYLLSYERSEEAERIGLECVPALWRSDYVLNIACPQEKVTLALIKNLLETESILGNEKIEGVVLKPRRYDVFDSHTGKVLMAKHVSEEFKEKHAIQWKITNTSSKEIIGQLGENLRTNARWEKAIQHLSEEGKLEGSPRDIGALIKEIQSDTFVEEKEWIKEKLYTFAKPFIQRAIVRGFPEWYKERLMEKAFGEKEDEN